MLLREAKFVEPLLRWHAPAHRCGWLVTAEPRPRQVANPLNNAQWVVGIVLDLGIDLIPRNPNRLGQVPPTRKGKVFLSCYFQVRLAKKAGTLGVGGGTDK